MTARMELSNGLAAVFERVDNEAADVIGHQLFTVTAFDAATMQVERVYSSDPRAYPVGGRKPKRDTEFGRRVLVDGQPLICEGDAEIVRIFDDHETIGALGLHSSINAPVVEGNRCVGVLNFLMAAVTVTPEQLCEARRFASDAPVIAALAVEKLRSRDQT